MRGRLVERRCCAKCRGIFFTRILTKVYCSLECGKSAQNARYYQRKKAQK